MVISSTSREGQHTSHDLPWPCQKEMACERNGLSSPKLSLFPTTTFGHKDPLSASDKEYALFRPEPFDLRESVQRLQSPLYGKLCKINKKEGGATQAPNSDLALSRHFFGTLLAY